MSQKMEGNDLLASIIAMHVRNAIEDIHADPATGLTDDVNGRAKQVDATGDLGGTRMRLGDR